MTCAAIYARVSSDQQKEDNTIASQTAALVAFAREQGFNVPDDWIIEDAGFSGASLARPGLERLRDLAAEGHIQAVLIHSPDRLSRKYAYQVLLMEEFARRGVETVFIKAPRWISYGEIADLIRVVKAAGADGIGLAADRLPQPND